VRYFIRRGAQETRVTVHGSVAYDATTALEGAVRGALEEGAARVIVDLADCPELSSMAVGLLIGFKIEAALGGRDLLIANPSDQVRRLLEIGGAAEALIERRPPPPDSEGARCPGTPS